MFKRKSFMVLAVILALTAVWAGFSTTSASAEDCPADNFFDVDGQNWNGFTIELNVYCTDEFLVIETNDLPNFDFVEITPNALAPQDYTINIPLHPVVAAQPTAVQQVGATGITVTGLLIYGPTEAPEHGSRDPYLDGILDYCGGHTHQGGVYHLHARPDCIFAEMDGTPYLVLGYSFDGFPILAPYVCVDEACTTIKEVQSSWIDANPEIDLSWERHEYAAGSGDLDECNGMFFEDGSYAYFATDTFPYFMGCYMGEVDQAGAGASPGGGAGGPGQDGNQSFGPPGQGSQPPGNFGGPGSGGPPNGGPPSGGRPGPGSGPPPRPNE